MTPSIRLTAHRKLICHFGQSSCHVKMTESQNNTIFVFDTLTRKIHLPLLVTVLLNTRTNQGLRKFSAEQQTQFAAAAHVKKMPHKKFGTESTNCLQLAGRTVHECSWTDTVAQPLWMTNPESMEKNLSDQLTDGIDSAKLLCRNTQKFKTKYKSTYCNPLNERHALRSMNSNYVEHLLLNRVRCGWNFCLLGNSIIVNI